MNKDQMKDKIKQYLCAELLNRPDYPLRDDEPLITGGLIDSFSLAYLGVFIEETFGVYIPDSDLTVAQMNTLDQIVQRVTQPA
jgi:acyl carrier protein